MGIPKEKERIIRTLARVYEDNPEEFMAYCKELGYADSVIVAGLLKFYKTEQKSRYVFVIARGEKSVQEFVDQYETARHATLRQEFLKSFKFNSN